MEKRVLKGLLIAAISIIVIAFVAVPLLLVAFIICIIAMFVVAFCKIFKIQLPFQKFINTIIEEAVNEDFNNGPYNSNEEQYPYPYVEDICEDF